jgi:PAS domain S-box-containing protein
MLERARAHLAAIVESSEDAIISKTLEGIVTSWNAAAERLFGYTAAQMVGRSILTVIPPELQHEEADILAQVRAGKRIERYETIRLNKDGSRLEISLTISPVLDSTGQIIGASKIAHDIGERRRAERQLKDQERRLTEIAAERTQLLESERAARAEAERLGRMKDEFLATLSHEMRTPLNAIQGWAALLRHKRSNPQDLDRGLETIERNVRIQTQIVNDLLDMSRIISGKIHLEIQPLQLHEVIDNAIDAIRHTADAKQIRVNTMLDSSIGWVRGDPARLQQVLWNLLTNAVKFTPAGGRIQVVLERVNSHAEIVIEDSGVGIEPEVLPYVFDRFRQGDATITRRYGGLGLGLSIVRTLVELHGGSVRVKSPGENLGSTFCVALPVSHVRPAQETDSRTATSSPDAVKTVELPRLDGVDVLLIDDDTDGRNFMSQILETQGARVTPAVSAAQGLELLAKRRFDILLSDIGMPEMDGYELLQRVRSITTHGPPIPAIAITAYARAEDRQRSLLAGFQMHLSKPIETRELIAGMASLLRLIR